MEEENKEVIENINEPNVNNENGSRNTTEGKKGFSVASLVLGLVGLVICALICGILAIVFGLKGRKLDGKNMATAGLILGIIDLIGWAIYMILELKFLF